MSVFAVLCIMLLQLVVLVQGFADNAAAQLLQNSGFGSSSNVFESFGGSSSNGPSMTSTSVPFNNNIFAGLTSSFGSDTDTDTDTNTNTNSRSIYQPRTAFDLLKNFQRDSTNPPSSVFSSSNDDNNAVQIVQKDTTNRMSQVSSTPSNGGISIMPTSQQPSSAPSNPPPTGTTYSGNGWVDAHNARRRRHCVPDVSWSSSVASSAQSHANRLASSCQFYHSSSGYGENLFMGSGSTYQPDYVLSKWYDEEKGMYSYNSPGFSSATGHFTQVVWRDTQYIGCATARCSRGEIVVCQYSSAGNVQGQFGQNVPREC